MSGSPTLSAPIMHYAGARLPNLERGSVGGASRLAYAANGRCDVRNLTREKRQLEKRAQQGPRTPSGRDRLSGGHSIPRSATQQNCMT